MPIPGRSITSGRREAKRRQLAYTGTLGVLVEDAKQELLDLPSVLSRLRQTSFYVTQDILDRLTGNQA